MGEDMTKIFGTSKLSVMMQTKDGRLINIGECNFKSERIEREDMDWKEPTRSFSFSAEIEPTGDLTTLLSGGTPKGRSIDLRKEKRTIFYGNDMRRMPRKLKKKLKRFVPGVYEAWKIGTYEDWELKRILS